MTHDIDNALLQRQLDSLRARTGQPTRRDVLRSALALAAAAMLPRAASAQTQPKPRFSGHPFTLGVASGYPSSDGVVLWTRLAPEPLRGDGGMAPERVVVGWEVAHDEAFRNIVRSGSVRAVPELAHSVRAEVDGLEPGRWYWYRFHAGDETSAVARTRTAPALDASPSLKLGFASCQHFEHGYYAPHRHMAREELDLVLFLGDYIYENTWGTLSVRRHAPTVEATKLAHYRVRHAQYKTDRDLQALHAAAPWLVTWDDHEVDNDYAGDRSEYLDPAFLGRRAAAYQAYFEHLPMPWRMLPRGSAASIHTHVDFGRSARIYLLDDRQYRSAIACPRGEHAGSADVVAADCAQLADASRTLLGAEQERWLAQRFADSNARWNVIAQQTLITPLDKTPGAGDTRWTDGWDGYAGARDRLVRDLAAHSVSNPIAIGGDIHANVVSNVPSDTRDPGSRIALAEFCGTSIASEGWPTGHWAQFRADNPHVVFTEDAKRGYTTLTLDAKQCRAELRGVDDASRNSGIATLASFVVEDGVAGVKPA